MQHVLLKKTVSITRALIHANVLMVMPGILGLGIWLPVSGTTLMEPAIPASILMSVNSPGNFGVGKSLLTPRLPTVPYALVPICAKLAHFGLWEDIAGDWDIVECREWCQKVGCPFFYHIYFKLEHPSNNTFSHNSKNQRPKYRKLYDFLTSRADCATLRGLRILKIVLKLQAIVCLSWIEVLITLFTKFYDLSVSRKPLSKVRKF